MTEQGKMHTGNHVRDRLDATIGSASEYTRTIGKQRETASHARRRQGWRFIWLGAALILSNLVVIPAMAWLISAVIEHPAAQAVQDLSELISEIETPNGNADDDATASGPAGRSAQVNALGAIANLKGQMRDFERAASQLPEALTDYIAKQAEAKTAVEQADAVIESLRGAIDSLEERQAILPATDDAPSPDATFSQAEMVALFGALPPETADYRVEERATNLWGNARWETVTDKYFIVPRATLSGSEDIAEARRRLDRLHEQRSIAIRSDDLAGALERADRLLVSLAGPTEDDGLVTSVRSTLTEVANAGDEINQLIKRAPGLQEDAQAAVETLSSTSKFIVPYGFAVLAIGAMFVSIGVSSVVKSLRLIDEGYEDSRDERQARLYAELIEALHSQDLRADPLIDRLGRIGETMHPSEVDSLPMPIARAVEAIADSFKKR